MSATTIFLTGATGIMGFESLKLLAESPLNFNIRILARRSKKNRRKLAPFLKLPHVVVHWGDLLNFSDVKTAMGDADIILHIGGMVSPEADKYPQATMNVNITAARNIVKVAKLKDSQHQPKVVYIGSIAETGSRDEPCHWGRIGDPILVSPYDYYGLSKVIAEREIVESGLRKWVVLRQSGILHPGLLKKGMDPITFSVPLRGVIEWTTLEDSARLMFSVCQPNVPDRFWNNIYHIGSGAEFRMTNYAFEHHILKALNCPAPEKIFEPSWFATRNFHGLYFEDSDELESLVPFRENIKCNDYFDRMKRQLPWYFSLAKFAPAKIIKLFMHSIARKKGTLSWLAREDCEQEIKAHFGSREAQASIPGWEDFAKDEPCNNISHLNHGYDDSIPLHALNLSHMQSIASYRGGKCLSISMEEGDLSTPLEWQCAFGHRFRATPLLIARGGHWCSDCFPAPWRYDAEARVNPFLAQVWHAAHSPAENEIYDANSTIQPPKD